ncbi:MAG: tripartite tricarboxylate transporter substrate binding protein [Rhodoferax sp.]|jgi:tripartite-type tricarboxylate transporter receptor subunit TctC|nr:tripartite tricarboxylate transporter substrate binding protein [Rhodoferax sp.]
MTLTKRHFIMGLAATAATPLVAQTSDYPSRTLRIVPFGTGGGPIAIVARSYESALSKRWGQSVIVDAKPGAAGILATDFIAKAAPDGYNLLLTLSLTHTTVPLLQKVPYDPIADFQPLTQIATGGPMLIVPANNPAGNLKEFVAWAKAKGRVTYGTWGTGSAAHLCGELLKRQTGAPLDHVAYKGEAAAHLDMYGGVLDVAWANPATAKASLDGGKIKILGITGSRRVSVLPQVATFTEQGFDGFALDSWLGFMGPARMPRPVVDKLAGALREITQSPEVRERLQALGFEPLGNTPEEFAVAQKAELPQWAALVKAAGVSIN